MEEEHREFTKEQLRLAYQAMARATRSGDWLNPLVKDFAPHAHTEMRKPVIARPLPQQGLKP